MNRILFGVFALGLFFAVAQALQCYKCDLCMIASTTVTCEVGQQCFTGTGKALAILPLKTKGCLPVTDCNKTSEVMNGTAVYQMTKTCCVTDLCNMAPRGAYGSLLAIALATLTGAMVTGALV